MTNKYLTKIQQKQNPIFIKIIKIIQFIKQNKMTKQKFKWIKLYLNKKRPLWKKCINKKKRLHHSMLIKLFKLNEKRWD